MRLSKVQKQVSKQKENIFVIFFRFVAISANFVLLIKRHESRFLKLILFLILVYGFGVFLVYAIVVK